MSESYLVVELNHQPVELCKLLKIANLVSGGGEAKIVISEGYVLLNGEVEYQKRKKIYHEDVVEFNGEVIQLIINDDLEDSSSNEQHNNNVSPSVVEPLQKNNTKQKNKCKDKGKKEHPLTSAEVVTPTGPKKRKPITF